MLSSYRVLDLTDEKGVFCGQLLGSFGADVIKIERPGGDSTRNIGPFVGDVPDPERSLFWLAYNTYKRSVTLNIETIDGQEIFKRLVKTADVVVESFAPGFMGRLGFSYSDLEKINPKIIMTSIAPFGQTGPYKNYKGSDLDCWALGGLLAGTGNLNHPPPHISHIFASFLLASQDAAWGTAMALYWRASSGSGQHVDVSIQESVVRTNFITHESWVITGMEPKRSNVGHEVLGGKATIRKVWEAKDGYIAFMVFGGQHGMRQTPQLVAWMEEEGKSDDILRRTNWSTFDWGSTSSEDGDRIQDCFARFFKEKTKAELLEGAIKRDIMIQPFATPEEVLNHPQLKARDYWAEVAYPHLGMTLRYPNHSCIPSEAPCRTLRRAPLVGEHNQEILSGELGLSAMDLSILKQSGAI